MRNFKFSICLLSVLIANILQVQSQDYNIIFNVMGTDSKTDSVCILNLDRLTEITILGDDTLHLINSSTGISKVNNAINKLHIYPNPVSNVGTIEFYNPEEGDVIVDVFDISSNKVAQIENRLPEGNCTYQLSGLGIGNYIVQITTKSNKSSEVLLSKTLVGSQPKIILQEFNKASIKSKNTKQVSNSLDMHYNSGERLRFIAYLNSVSSTEELIPTSNQIIEFELLPVTDFTATPLISSIDNQVSFSTTNLASEPNSWVWEFGDGNTSTEINPTHKYSSAGSFTVSLTVTNDCGSTTNTKNNYIKTYSIEGNYDVATTMIDIEGDTINLSWTEEIRQIEGIQYRTTRVGHYTPLELGGTPGYTFLVDENSILTIPSQDLVEFYNNEVVGTSNGSIELESGILYMEYSIFFTAGNRYYKSTYTPVE